MPYFGVGADASFARPPVTYRQPPQHHTRGRLGQSLSDILGTISDVAGTVSADTSGSSYGSLPPSYYATPAPTAAPSSGLSTTTLFGIAAVGLGVLYFATRKP